MKELCTQGKKWLSLRLPEYPGKIISAVVRNDRVVQLHVNDEHAESLLGSIYIGKIQNLVNNLGAAFIEIGKGQLCYAPISELTSAIREDREKKFKPGDEIVVQVTKEALKTKLPGVSGKLALTGTYLVLTAGKCQLGLSSKLTQARREQLKEAISDLVTEEYGFIVRTNAQNADEDIIRREAYRLSEIFHRLQRDAASRTCFSCIYHAEGNTVRQLRRAGLEGLSEIVTDIPEVYREARDFLDREQLGGRVSLRLYEDPLLSLGRLYSIPSVIQDALKERVWLKSGGYLVIQPTEALTVIDVNTGKYDGKKNPEETFLKINLEAAAEAARQICLRNLSGILLIDFIDMKDPAHTLQVASVLKAHLKEDTVKADFVDFTKLGLAEVTRKKEERPLSEQLKG